MWLNLGGLPCKVPTDVFLHLCPPRDSPAPLHAQFEGGCSKAGRRKKTGLGSWPGCACSVWMEKCAATCVNSLVLILKWSPSSSPFRLSVGRGLLSVQPLRRKVTIWGVSVTSMWHWKSSRGQQLNYTFQKPNRRVLHWQIKCWSEARFALCLPAILINNWPIPCYFLKHNIPS